MDSVIERYLKRWEINGAQLVITRNDSLLYARGFGMADKERGIRMEPNMLMRFASVSKLITAVGIMKLQEMKNWLREKRMRPLMARESEKLVKLRLMKKL